MKASGWHKLGAFLLGVSIIVGLWQWSTWHLYSLPETSINSFTSITNNCLYGVVVLVVWFVTGRLVMDWKNNTSTVVSQIGQQINERRTEQIDETLREFSTPELTERYGER